MRALIVDDEPDVRGAARWMLEASGHQVQEAPDGAAALRLLACGGVDVVLCDLFMPGVDGIEFIRAARERYPSVALVAMSGGWPGRPADLLPVARALGASATLAKPFTRQALLQAIGG